MIGWDPNTQLPLSELRHWDIGTTVGDLPSQGLPYSLKTSEKAKGKYGIEVILYSLFHTLSHSTHL